jgi:hypothetical protein
MWKHLNSENTIGLFSSRKTRHSETKAKQREAHMIVIIISVQKEWVWRKIQERRKIKRETQRNGFQWTCRVECTRLRTISVCLPNIAFWLQSCDIFGGEYSSLGDSAFSPQQWDSARPSSSSILSVERADAAQIANSELRECFDCLLLKN